MDIGKSTTYRQLRKRHCGKELQAVLKRWGVYLMVGAVMAGIGAPALAAGIVLPLFWALANTGWAALVILAYMLMLGLLLWAARHLLWPPKWAEIERGLPIPFSQIFLSDFEIVSFALLPMAFIMWSGAAILIVNSPDWLEGIASQACLSLVLVMIGSATLAVAGLQGLRSTTRNSTVSSTFAHGRISAEALRHWAWALVWTPLKRGAAPRSVVALSAGGALLLLTALLPSLGQGKTQTWLMLFSALALIVTTCTHSLIQKELKPLHDQCHMLPLNRPAVARLRTILGLLPGIFGLGAWLLQLSGESVRPAAFVLFLVVTLVGWILQVRWPGPDATSQAARWLFTLILGIAMASEVVRNL